MQAQSFLSILKTHFNPEKSNKILSNPSIKNCWKHWLSAELTHTLNAYFQPDSIEADVAYPAANEESGTAYLGYKSHKYCADIVEKRSASKSDFVFELEKKKIYFEVRCGHYETFLKNQELKKFTSDLSRVKALKVANPELNIVVIFAVYGCFKNQEMQKFKTLDNSDVCGYVWDSGVAGSSSIARLSHMRREGDPRVLFIAYQF